MTFLEYLTRFGPALSAPCGLPQNEVLDVTGIAEALYKERNGYLGMHADALEFMDNRVAMCGSREWIMQVARQRPAFIQEAKYRYAVALELWLKIQRGDKAYIGQPTPPAKGSVTCTPKPTPIPTPPTRSTSTVIAESS